MKVQLENVVIELTSEAVPVRTLPLSIDDLESDILVGRARLEAQDGKVRVVLTLCLKNWREIMTIICIAYRQYSYISCIDFRENYIVLFLK